MTNVHPLQTSSTSTDALPISWIEALFDKMSLSYGKKFVDQWGGVNPEKLKQHWAEGLATMTRAELSRGYAALESRDWPPTLPEFKKLCRPSINIDAAVTEAIEQIVLRTQAKDRWSHPAIYWAAQKVGYFELTTSTHAQVKARLAPILDDLLAKGNIPDIPAHQFQVTDQTASQPGTPLSPDQKAQLRQQIHSFLNKSTGQADHRAWAKRIVARAEGNPEAVTPLQLRFAKEALSAPEAI